MYYHKLVIATLLGVALVDQEHLRSISSVSGDQMSQASEFWNKENLYKNIESTRKSDTDKHTLEEIISEFDELPETNSEHYVLSNNVRNSNNNYQEQAGKERTSSTKREDSNVGDIFRLIANLARIKTEYDVKSTVLGENDNIVDISKDQSQKKSSSEYPSRNDNYWRLELDDEANYVVYWYYNYLENHITIELQLNLAAFQFGIDLFALGFSNNEKLINSDWCVFWIDAETSIQLQPGYTDSLGDMRILSNIHPKKCKLISSSIYDNKLTILYRRPIDPCDDDLGYKIDNGTTHVVWFKLQGPIGDINNLGLDFAAQSSQPRNGDAAFKVNRQYKIEQNFRRAQLLSPVPTNVASNEKKTRFMFAAADDGGKRLVKSSFNYTRHYNVTNNRLAVPSDETTYWCKIFKLPEDIQHSKHHIIRYEAIIEKGNEHLVHHMELFHCETYNELERDESFILNHWSGSCTSPERPKQINSCKRVILAWAMGARPLIYPNEVGQPIGGNDYNPFLMLEIHYNNVDRRSNIIDSSGLRLYYTNQLRHFDAGVMEVGLEYTDKNSIPPNVVAPLIGYCVSECTRVGLTNESGINIFAAQLHTHLVGISSWTQLIRGNKIIGDINRDDHYSPHFQEIRLLPEPVKILPGDAIVHYCLYNTKNRVNITLGGYAITDEMCVTYLHYYPKVQLEVCKSSIDTDTLMDYFRLLAKQEYQIVDWQNNSVTQNYQSIEWNPLRAAKLLSLYNESPLSVQCNKSNGDRFPGEWNGIWPTKVINQESVVDCAQNQTHFIEATINQRVREPTKHPLCSGRHIRKHK